MRGSRAACVEACMLALKKAGIVVEQGHSESSLNQFEIPTGPLPLLEAIDAVMCTREIISETALSHGFRAIFIPKPFPDLRPSVLHLHLSIHAAHEQQSPEAKLYGSQEQYQMNSIDSITEPTAVTAQNEAFTASQDLPLETINSFLAGILERLIPLCAFSRSSQNSYRPSPAPSTTGDFVAWGLKNSSVPLNEVCSGHWEIRILD